jgi:hypothetical protein
VLERFDCLIAGLLDAGDWQTESILITADNADLEDLAVRTRTPNLVPTIVFVDNYTQLASGMHGLIGVAPVVERYLTGCTAGPRLGSSSPSTNWFP